ncbi:MAG: hypothetical protein IJ358_03110 [Clostridia bacterium]|nr:hypothetical protein [Clostridia bacterium]
MHNTIQIISYFLRLYLTFCQKYISNAKILKNGLKACDVIAPTATSGSQVAKQ